MKLTEFQLLECQRNALLRNIITHNNSIINQIYINGISNFKIKDNPYAVEDSILPNLEEEINKQRATFKEIVAQIMEDLELSGNLRALEGRNNSLKSKL